MRRNRRRNTSGKRRGYKLYFQVYAEFSFVKGKPQLLNTSIFSTYAACTTIPLNPLDYSFFTISRIFHNLDQAASYCAYLHGVYPNSPALPPPQSNDGK
jgi:hypothetical protein